LSETRREALVALAAVLLPSLVLAVALLSLPRLLQAGGNAGQATGFPWDGARLVRQCAVSAFMVLPLWFLARARRASPAEYGWQRERLRRAAGLGLFWGLAVLLFRAAPLRGGALAEPPTWYALATCAVAAVAEETTYRGFLQPRCEAWLGPGWGWAASAGLAALAQVPARLVMGEAFAAGLVATGASPGLYALGPALRAAAAYFLVQIVPTSVLFGAAMVISGHALTPALVNLAWNWSRLLGRP
jgi:membrane protease YdiL (CAAX protease family)